MAPTQFRNILAFMSLGALLSSSQVQAFGRFHPRNNLGSSCSRESQQARAIDAGSSSLLPVSVSIETICTATITSTATLISISASVPASAWVPGSETETPHAARPGNAWPPSLGDGSGNHVHTATVTSTVTVAGPTVTDPGSTVTISGSISTVTQPTTVTVNIPLSPKPNAPPSSDRQEAEPTPSISSTPSGVPANPTTAAGANDSTYSWSWENSGLGPESEVYSGGFNGGINGGFSEGFTLGYSGAYTEYTGPRNTEVASSGTGGSHVPTACGLQTVAKTVFSTVTRTVEPGTGVASSNAHASALDVA